VTTEKNTRPMTRIARTEVEHYGLPVFRINDRYYAVAVSREAAETAAGRRIDMRLYEYPAEVLVPHMAMVNYNPEGMTDLIVAVEAVRMEMRERSNPLLKALIPLIRSDVLHKAVIDAYGLGPSLTRHNRDEESFSDIFECDENICREIMLGETGATSVDKLRFYHIGYAHPKVAVVGKVLLG